MTAKDLTDLFDYCYWANGRLFDVVLTLCDEEFTRDLTGGHGSVRATLVHVLNVEWGWLERCGGPARGPALQPASFPAALPLRHQFQRLEALVRDFLASCRDADLRRTVEFSFGRKPKYAMPMGEVMNHAAIHGVHHRGQVAAMLRTLGHDPGNFDLLSYYAELAPATAAY